MPTMTIETPQFFLNRDRKRLFGILHEADASAARQNFAVVFCAALFEDKLWSHRVMVNFARYLASRGVSVLRFDYFGDGESEGRFDEASVTTRTADIADAVTFCRERTKIDRVYLLGLCYGATLALHASLREGTGAGVVAWAPVMDGGRYAAELLRTHLTAQMVLHRKIVHDREALVRQIMADETVNIEGYEIGRALYTEMIGLDLMPLLRSATTPVLAMQIAPSERVDPAYHGLSTLQNRSVRFDVVRELKFWTQQKTIFPYCEPLFERTTEWLARAVH
jgi:exosortase A-associated hydrolase 2